MMFCFPFQCPPSEQFTFLSSIPVANSVYLCNRGRQMCARGLCPAMTDRLEVSPPAFVVGTEKPDQGLQGKMVYFSTQMGMETERCGDKIS